MQKTNRKETQMQIFLPDCPFLSTVSAGHRFSSPRNKYCRATAEMNLRWKKLGLRCQLLSDKHIHHKGTTEQSLASLAYLNKSLRLPCPVKPPSESPLFLTHPRFLSRVLCAVPAQPVCTTRRFLPWDVPFAVPLIPASNEYGQDAARPQRAGAPCNFSSRFCFER